MASAAPAPRRPGRAAAPSGGPASLTAAEAVQQIRAGTLSSVALVTACLQRIEQLNPKLDAIITVARDQALATAAACDDEARQGRYRGPLHGVPILLKDNIDTQGIRTTAASLVYENRVPDADAEVARRLAAAGAIMLGKTNMHEFAGGITSASSYFRPVRNPWALDRDAAGSSSGSAAAISGDLACAAIGTDTGGSVRAPAAYCSIVGLKPTYGLVPISGIVPLVPSLDHCGPMTKSVEDAALLLTIMAGYDRTDIASVEHGREDYSAAIGQPIGALRLGVARAPFFDLLDPDVASAVETAIGTLGAMMAASRDVRLPDTGDFGFLGTAEIEAYHLDLFRSRPAQYGLHFRNVLTHDFADTNDVAGEPCAEKVVDYVRASWRLARLRRMADDIFAGCDVIALPTMRQLPRTLDELIDREEKGGPTEPEVNENCLPFNVLGLPAISLPCGFSSTGLPIGLMLAGPRFSEARLLAVAHAFEQATLWHRRKPPLHAKTVVPPIKWRT
jgi:aspartyl-tRNA(Asn)/glutamyl-tRNA(Gln) amidotransferase subunit A